MPYVQHKTECPRRGTNDGFTCLCGLTEILAWLGPVQEEDSCYCGHSTTDHDPHPIGCVICDCDYLERPSATAVEAPLCECGHDQETHWHRALACMASTTAETWACDCAVYRAPGD